MCQSRYRSIKSPPGLISPPPDHLIRLWCAELLPLDYAGIAAALPQQFEDAACVKFGGAGIGGIMVRRVEGFDAIKKAEVMQAHDPWVMIGYEVKMFNAT